MTQDNPTQPNFSEKQRDYLDACRTAPYLSQVRRARKVKVATATVSNWKHDDALFAHALSDALAEGKRLALSDLDDKVAEHSSKAVDTALQLMTNAGTAPTVRLQAATYFIDRALGKPKERKEVTGKDGGPQQHEYQLDLDGLSDDELDLLERIALRAGGEGSSQTGPAPSP